jgi:hypothetical protein
MALLEVKALGDVTVAKVRARWLSESEADGVGEDLSDLADGLGRGELHEVLAVNRLTDLLDVRLKAAEASR